MQKTFRETVCAMSAKEIIMAMVEGLRHPKTDKVDMFTYGFVTQENFGGPKICIGCAATNTICQISGKPFTPESIIDNYQRAKFLGIDQDFLLALEDAIDDLRIGDIELYNHKATNYGFATIDVLPAFELPILTTSTYQDNLEPYEKLANLQD